MENKRAVGIVRVSETGGRTGDSFASPDIQRASIEAACKRSALVLTTIHEELDISGGRPLDKRPGLREAVKAIEDGDADVIAAAYFDRLFRSLQTQAEVLDRVERAGGQVLAVDVGRVTNGSAGQWLSATMLGAVAEYHRRTTRERTAEAQALAVARGVPITRANPGYRATTTGYRRDGKPIHGPLEPDPVTAPIVAEAFQLRADGKSVYEVRRYLLANDVNLTHSSVSRLLENKAVLGELHFGDLHNLKAHEPIVARDVFQRAQRVKAPRGRKSQSNRLLARLGILRCGSCGARMVVGKASNPPLHYVYRCPPTGDCTKRMTISAPIVEDAVIAAIKEETHDTYGLWNKAATNARQAQAALDKAQSDLDKFVRMWSSLDDEDAVRERQIELKTILDQCQKRVDRLGGPKRVKLTVTNDWESLSLDEQREKVVSLIETVTIAPGRGKDRIAISLIDSNPN